ncbi:hypothetical protein [Oceanobacillus senegalensis]|uniref:hypothetical protein n=1 Tax=Oceanobacillus senegalensis TaxID=1936063 RepID=UPI000A30AA5B|nr:hypothetical protein [Oceanobacillus senegalensis]
MDKHYGTIDRLNEVMGSVTHSNELIAQAIQKYASDPVLYEEALKQATKELTHVQSVIDQSMFSV